MCYVGPAGRDAAVAAGAAARAAVAERAAAAHDGFAAIAAAAAPVPELELEREEESAGAARAAALRAFALAVLALATCTVLALHHLALLLQFVDLRHHSEKSLPQSIAAGYASQLKLQLSGGIRRHLPMLIRLHKLLDCLQQVWYREAQAAIILQMARTRATAKLSAIMAVPGVVSGANSSRGVHARQSARTHQQEPSIYSGDRK
eukprot:scaffold15874_cov150-Isochrysis_galbana.AAC.2